MRFEIWKTIGFDHKTTNLCKEGNGGRTIGSKVDRGYHVEMIAWFEAESFEKASRIYDFILYKIPLES